MTAREQKKWLTQKQREQAAREVGRLFRVLSIPEEAIPVCRYDLRRAFLSGLYKLPELYALKA